jgi:hypothetical protein
MLIYVIYLDCRSLQFTNVIYSVHDIYMLDLTKNEINIYPERTYGVTPINLSKLMNLHVTKNSVSTIVSSFDTLLHIYWRMYE